MSKTAFTAEELSKIAQEFQYMALYKKRAEMKEIDARLKKDLLISVNEALKNATKKINEMQEETQIDGWTKATFVEFLENTLIPDLHESGNDATTEDLETAVKFIKGE
jgi:hypothetical protein